VRVRVCARVGGGGAHTPPHVRPLNQVCFFLDYNLDESYTPKKLSVRAGSTFHDLVEVQVVDLAEPQGWVTVPLFAVDDRGERMPLRVRVSRLLQT